jgi:lipid A 4'-phosphatase
MSQAVREAAAGMHYFKLRRGRIALGAFLAFAILAMTLPGIDLAVSGLFYDGHSFIRGRAFQAAQQLVLLLFLCISTGTVVAIYAYNRTFGRNLGGINGRRVLFLLLVLGIGPGLIVNTTLKDNFGRARPRDVTEFGGSKAFTPAFVLSRECNKNCSFSSGDAAGGFFAIALALALSRRRTVFVAALLFGAAISLSRIASGAHFFSDTVVSFFIMLILSDLLHHYIVLSDVERRTLVPAVALRTHV